MEPFQVDRQEPQCNWQAETFGKCTFVEGNCSPGTAVAVEQAVVEADQKRQELVPAKLVVGHIPGTAEVAGVQSADYNWLNTAHHTAEVAEVAEVAPAAAAHHNQPVAGTVGTAGLQSDLLVSELLCTVAAAAELLVGELLRRRRQCCQECLIDLLQEHLVALKPDHLLSQMLT